MKALAITTCAAAIVVVVALTARWPVSGDQLLVNPGFEEGLTGWASIDVALEITNQPRQGSNAMLLSSQNTEQATDFFQWLPVDAGQSYDFSGYVLLNDPDADRVFLRVSWFNTSNDFISSEDSPWLVGNINEYRRIATGARVSPSGAVMARVSVQVTASGPVSIVADDMSFDGPAAATPTMVASPSLPLMTPTATPGPSPSPTPSIGPSPTSSKTPTPNPTAARTPTPTRIVPSATLDEPLVFGTLTNGGFEGRGVNGPYGWRKIGGRIESVASPVHGGGVALAVSSEGTSSTKWAYQTVAVGQGEFYEAAAYVWKNDHAAETVFLRISWYESTDGTGEAIESTDSSEVLQSDQPGYRRLTTEAVRAPGRARTAKVRLMVRPAGDRPATAYFDDVTFDSTNAPTAVPTRTPNPTSEPTPTATSIASSTASVPPRTPTRAPSATLTSAPVASPTPTATPVPLPDEPLVFAALNNGGFEVARDDGTPYGWRKAGGQLAVTSEGPAQGSLALELVSTSGSTKWAYQVVTVDPGQYYEATAWARTGDGASALLRISWYAPEDGEGQALGSEDSKGSIESGSSKYGYLTTETVRAPDEARSARIRLMARPTSDSRVSVVFDQTAFHQVDPPISTVAATVPPAVLGAVSSPRPPSSSEGQAVGAGVVQQTSATSDRDGRTPAAPTNIHPARDEGARNVGASENRNGFTTGDALVALGIGLPLAGIGGMLSLRLPVHRAKRDE